MCQGDDHLQSCDQCPGDDNFKWFEWHVIDEPDACNTLTFDAAINTHGRFDYIGTDRLCQQYDHIQVCDQCLRDDSFRCFGRAVNDGPDAGDTITFKDAINGHGFIDYRAAGILTQRYDNLQSCDQRLRGLRSFSYFPSSVTGPEGFVYEVFQVCLFGSSACEYVDTEFKCCALAVKYKPDAVGTISVDVSINSYGLIDFIVTGKQYQQYDHIQICDQCLRDDCSRCFQSRHQWPWAH